MTYFFWIIGGFTATLLYEFKHILLGRPETSFYTTQKNYRAYCVLQQLHTTKKEKAGIILPHRFKSCTNVQVITFLPQCASLGTQERCLFLKTGNL